jgi:histidinol-phosphatase (PHP family)
MISTDYHVHTTFSPDGHDTPEAMCEQALALGLAEIAFTEHVEWFAPVACRPDFPRYFDAIARCRDTYGPRGLQVLSGVEIGNPHDYLDDTLALLNIYQFDVVIASLHWLSGQNIQRVSCFRSGSAADTYTSYFTNLAAMAGYADFAVPTQRLIIGHFDRILWAGVLAGVRPDLKQLEPVIRDTWAVVVGTGAALELNTHLLGFSPNWRYELALMLGWFRDEGGRRVVINSDAHRTEHLGANFPLASALLTHAGLVPASRLVPVGRGAPAPALLWHYSGSPAV